MISFDGKGFYPWQFQMRIVTLRPQHLSFVAGVFWGIYAARFAARPFQLAGADAGAVPVITAIQIAAMLRGLDVNAFTIRKQPKKYGLLNTIEGVPNELPVVIIDDLTSPIHETMWITLNTILRARMRLYGTAFVIVYKGDILHSQPVIPTSQGSVKIEAIYTLNDFDLSFEDYAAKKAAGKL